MNEIDLAIDSIDRDAFVLQEDGTPLLQSTATSAIKDSLQLLDLEEGQQIMEIGTGSGYSTALLSKLVGKSGHVVSLDIDPNIVNRAKRRLSEHQITNVTVLTRDGREGYKEKGQFDRIVAWTTADDLPVSWMKQLKPNGVIVAPFMLLPLANTTAIARLYKVDEEIVGDLLVKGSYIHMNETPNYESYSYELRADIVEKNGSEIKAWGSANWMKHADVKTKQHWLQMLKKQSLSCRLLKGGERYDDFRAFLLAKQPREFTTAFLEKTSLFIGASTPSSFALLSIDGFLAQKSDQSIHFLLGWLEEWRSLGSPGFNQLKPVVKKDDENWVVRAELDFEKIKNGRDST